MKEPTTHMHRMGYTGQGPYAIYGAQLESGDVLEANDRYDSSSGRWDLCPCPGLKIEAGVATVWVRPMEMA